MCLIVRRACNKRGLYTAGDPYHLEFPNGKDKLMDFQVTLKPDEGYYKGGKFVFTFKVPMAGWFLTTS